jgi:hypothetical protein
MKSVSKLKVAFWLTASVVGLLFAGYQAIGWYWYPFEVVNAMKNLSWGLNDYYDKHGAYPSDLIYGQPDHSWRIRVLQEIYPPEEQTESSRALEKYNFDKSWDDASNRRVAKQLLGPGGWILAVKRPDGDWLASEFMAAKRTKERIPLPVLLVHLADSPYASNEPGDLVWDGESDSMTVGSLSLPLTKLRGERMIRSDGHFDVVPEDCDLQTVKAMLRDYQW